MNEVLTMETRAFEAADRVEELVHDALVDLQLDEGLGDRIMSALPPREEMLPALHPALRLGFGLAAAAFAVSAWLINLPRVYGASPEATYFGLGAIMLGAAIGATSIAIAIIKDAGPRAFAAARQMLSGTAGNAIVATVAAVAILATTYVLLGAFPDEYMMAGVRAARSSVATLAVVLTFAAVVQVRILARGQDWRPALRLVEAGGLVLAALACAANYVVFVA
jgi:hypothetical protein